MKGLELHSTGPISSSLLPRAVCPQCFTKFRPEDVLWVSEHQDLFNQDNRVPNEQARFLPSRFTPAAQAIDPRGFPCHRLACPNCHLEVPRAILELEPYFLSILGAPGSGKSFFLAAMSSRLRRVLPLSFHTTFADADAALNARLKKFESDVFANSRPDQIRGLHELVEKTQEEGLGYATVNFGNQPVQYLRPFIFTMQIQSDHPNPRVHGFGKTICLYDNAGESFLPGRDKAASPVTRHLAESRMLFYLYDPLQDSRFRSLDSGLNDGIVDKSHLGAQEAVFQEAARRIRTFSGLSSVQKYPRPLIVIVTKCDRWMHLIDRTILYKTPIVAAEMKMSDGSRRQLSCLDTGLIGTVSAEVRKLLLKTTPEVVSAVESFSDNVRYIPVSATGKNTLLDMNTGLQVIRPAEADPFWTEVPFLYSLASASLGLVPKLKRPSSDLVQHSS